MTNDKPLVTAKVLRRTAMATASTLALIVGQAIALAEEATPIPDVSVTDRRGDEAPEGSEAAGYKPATVSNLGPLGQKSILDTPYSVNVVSSALIENLQLSRTEDLYRIDPVIQTRSTSTRGWSPNFMLRGFAFANGSGTAEDGMRMQNLFSVPLEDKERVEVYTGLTSFLYGPNNVGGLLNYVYKRPTDKPLANVTLGNYGGLSKYVHGDFGGPIDADGQFSYRLNIVGQDGETAVDTQSIRRDALTAALAWRPVQDLTMTLIGSHHDQIVRGADVSWSFATNADGSSKVRHPAAPDATRNFGQPFGAYSSQTDRIGVDLKWKANDIFTLRAAYSYAMMTVRDNFYVNNNVSTADGLYSQTAGHNTNYHYHSNSGYAFLDASFDTGCVHHKLTTGFYGDDYRQRNAPTSYAAKTLAGLNFVTPTYYTTPSWVAANYGAVGTSTYNNERNVILGDEISFDKQWSLLVGGNYTWLHASNFTVATGMLSSGYEQSRLSPSASLIFKPQEWLSTYATYSESLQSGQAVSSSGAIRYTNAGATLPPYVGRQYEIGAKADLGGVLLTASLFQIEQALQYARYNGDGAYTYVQDGRQRNRGLEFTATGVVTDGLRVFGGLTLLDPRVTQSGTSTTAPSIDGKVPVGIARTMFKISGEYDLPFAPGLTLTGGYYFTGQQAVDRLNTEYLPSFGTEDIGFRYRASELFGRKLPLGQEFILRFDVTNVADARYWVTSNYVGQPRTFAVSAQLKF